MNIHDDLYRRGLVRPRDRRVIAGVCAGIANRLGIDPWATRLLFLLVLMVLPGSPLLIYPILWILMPDEAPRVAPYGEPYAQAAYGQPYAQTQQPQGQYPQGPYAQAPSGQPTYGASPEGQDARPS